MARRLGFDACCVAAFAGEISVCNDMLLLRSVDGEEAYFPKKLLDLTMKIQRKSNLEFPEMPFAYAQCTNPALQFANSICHVLSLDQLIEDEVHLLKRVRTLIGACCNIYSCCARCALADTASSHPCARVHSRV